MGSAITRFTEEDVQKMMSDNPDLSWSQIKARMAQQDARAERVPTQQDLLMEEIYGDNQRSTGAAAADANSSPADPRDMSLKM